MTGSVLIFGFREYIFHSMNSRVLIFCVLALLAAGCPSETRPGRVRVSDDDQLQVKFQTARRALADIKELKRRGHDYSADCKTVKMLFVKDLKKLKAPAAQRLAKDIVVACQGVKLR